MDPLSIIASVVSLIMAARKVYGILSTFTSNVRDTPPHVHAVFCDINDLRTALNSLHQLLLRLDSTPRKRTVLIKLDQLIVNLTEAVFTFLELECLVTALTRSSFLGRNNHMK
jgi:hypothetical protein